MDTGIVVLSIRRRLPGIYSVVCVCVVVVAWNQSVYVLVYTKRKNKCVESIVSYIYSYSIYLYGFIKRHVQQHIHHKYVCLL